MNAKTTVVLAFVFMALGTVAFFDPFGWKDAKEQKAEAENHVLLIKDQRIGRITIHAEGKETKLECTKLQSGCGFDFTGEWKLVKPIEDEGDASNIGSMLNSLRNLAPVSHLEATPAEWKDFGLDKPDPELEIELTNGQKLDLGFGAESAIGSNRYLRTNTNEKEVFLVASFFPGILNHDLFYWRNKRILRGVETEAVERFAWNGGAPIEVKREGAGWKIVKPYTAPANKVAIESLLNVVLYASGKKIVSETGVPPKGAKRIATVAISVKGRKEIKAEVFSTPKKDTLLQLVGGKIIYTVDGVPFERFKKPVTEFRVLRLLSYPEVNTATELKFRFSKEKQEIALKKNGESWERASGPVVKEPLSQTRIKDFLDTLAGLDAERFTREPAKVRKFATLADLEVTISKKTLRFVLDGKNSVLANGDVSGEARIMGENFLKSLPVRLADLFESHNKPIVIKEPENNGKQRALREHP